MKNRRDSTSILSFAYNTSLKDVSLQTLVEIDFCASF